MKNIDNQLPYNIPKQPEYQDLLAIQLEETPEEEAPNSTSVIEVSASADTPKEVIEEKVRRKLQEQNWWLQDYWKEKGIPKEQIIIQTPVGNLEFYNFGQPLEQRHIDELQYAIQALSPINEGELLRAIKYILVDDTQETNSRTGEDLNGYGPVHEQAIKLYPNGIKFIPHRIPSASNFTGTLIHELTHGIPKNIINDWAQEFGWHMLDNPKKLPGGAHQYYETDTPQNCVTDYACFSPDEDICESMVAYTTNYAQLDPRKKEFIESRLLEGNPTTGEISITRKANNEIELPKILGPIKYRRTEPKKFDIKT